MTSPCRSIVPVPYSELRLDGVVRGVVRRRPEGSGVAGQPVRVLPFAESFPGDVITVTTSAQGVFSATGVIDGPGVMFGLATEYESAEYTAVLTDTLAATLSSCPFTPRPGTRR